MNLLGVILCSAVVGVIAYLAGYENAEKKFKPVTNGRPYRDKADGIFDRDWLSSSTGSIGVNPGRISVDICGEDDERIRVSFVTKRTVHLQDLMAENIFPNLSRLDKREIEFMLRGAENSTEIANFVRSRKSFVDFLVLGKDLVAEVQVGDGEVREGFVSGVYVSGDTSTIRDGERSRAAS